MRIRQPHLCLLVPPINCPDRNICICFACMQVHPVFTPTQLIRALYPPYPSPLPLIVVVNDLRLDRGALLTAMAPELVSVVSHSSHSFRVLPHIFSSHTFSRLQVLECLLHWPHWPFECSDASLKPTHCKPLPPRIASTIPPRPLLQNSALPPFAPFPLTPYTLPAPSSPTLPAITLRSHCLPTHT